MSILPFALAAGAAVVLPKIFKASNAVTVADKMIVDFDQIQWQGLKSNYLAINLKTRIANPTNSTMFIDFIFLNIYVVTDVSKDQIAQVQLTTATDAGGAVFKGINLTPGTIKVVNIPVRIKYLQLLQAVGFKLKEYLQQGAIPKQALIQGRIKANGIIADYEKVIQFTA